MEITSCMIIRNTDRCTFSEQTLITFSTEFLIMNSACHVCGTNTYALLQYSGSHKNNKHFHLLTIQIKTPTRSLKVNETIKQ